MHPQQLGMQTNGESSAEAWLCVGNGSQGFPKGNLKDNSLGGVSVLLAFDRTFEPLQKVG